MIFVERNETAAVDLVRGIDSPGVGYLFVHPTRSTSAMTSW